MKKAEEYLAALKVLFSKNPQELTDIARKNNNTISTIEICYLCYNRNLLPISFLNNFEYSTFLGFINITDVSSSESEITVTDECCYFIDKFSEFVKLRNVANSKKHKPEYYGNYIAYLFMTDTKLKVNNAIKQCLPNNTFNNILDTIILKLLSVVNIPYDESFVSYGKFLTNPFDESLVECYGRDKEITDIVDVLCRKNKNNPLLIGQPGVGKTAVVQGVANLLMSSKCPKQLENYHIFELYIASLVSGTMYRGDLEKRVTTLLDTIINKCSNVIIFIDEIHSIMNGKNESESSSSTAGVSIVDMLKPYMTGNKIKLIGATTEQEYKILEDDKALLRRFNKISIKEPNKNTVLHLMENICKDYEAYFDLKCSEAVLSTVVDYADLYMPNRFMPDKAIDLLDQSFVHCKNHSDRTELNDFDIINSIESMTSISVPTPNEDIGNKISNIINNIKSKLVGQDEVIKITESLLKKYFMGLCNPKKPISSFLFVGPTGVGKTALCRELATNLFNRESFVKLDMSEYMEKYAISKLIGSPPGYVGHTKGGKLTEIVKHNPYSIILFDEIEKAHSDIYNILLQILDEGVLTDSEGYTANFKNCIIVLTSNLGAADIEAKSKNTVGFGDTTLSDKDKNKIYENAVKKYFTPEFINRLDHIVYFNSLTKQNIADIVDIELTSLVAKFKNIKVDVNISENTKKLLYDRCYTKEYGARFVQREITKLVEDIIIEYLLEHKLIGIDTTVNLDVDNNSIEVLQPMEVNV